MMTKMTKRIGIMAIGLAVASGCATTGDKVEKPIVAVDETPAALFDAGERALLAQQNENAKNLFLKGLGLQPTNDAGNVGLSEAYIRLGMLSDAQLYLRLSFKSNQTTGVLLLYSDKAIKRIKRLQKKALRCSVLCMRKRIGMSWF